MSTDYLKPEDKKWIADQLALTTSLFEPVKNLVEYVPAEDPVDFEDIPRYKPKRFTERIISPEDEERERLVSRYRREQEEVIAFSRKATRRDYGAWLDGYKARGGKIENAWSYDFPVNGWYVLMAKPAYIPALYGAFSLSIIVPEHIELRPHHIKWDQNKFNGHNDIYLMRGFTAISGTSVVSFDDVK